MRYLLKFAFLLLFIAPILAQEPNKVTLTLLAESQTVGHAKTLLMGVRAQMAPGWKTYWRSPGVSGYGITLNWDGSKNIKSAQVLWPLPHRVSTQMGQVNAYENEVIFPIRVEVIDPSQDIDAVIGVDMLVCDETTCLPVMETLKLRIPSGPQTESPQSTLLQQALAKVPQHHDSRTSLPKSLRIDAAEVIDADTLSPKIQVSLSKINGEFTSTDLPNVFLEMKDLFVDQPESALSQDHKTVHFTARVYPDANRTPTHLENLKDNHITLTIAYQDAAFEVESPLQEAGLTLSFWIMILGVAFIGGLILNIMPCVLPVLSLKILSIMRHGGGHHATVRQEFLATVFGIVCSFLALAGFAIFLKETGHVVGWGMQFQDPYFLIALIAILTLFSCNLFGFFEFRLPEFLSSLGSFTPHRESLVGSFLEGGLVTLLATPCTAPFLGTALAFALSRGAFEIIVIFLAMGVGLAFPFFLIAFFPKVATRLPKPGAWMSTAKKLLGIIIAITGLWLAYVLMAEIGVLSTAVIVTLMTAISALLRINARNQFDKRRRTWIGVTSLIIACFILPTFLPHSTSAAPSTHHSIWKPFEPERIHKYVKAGKTVFVSVTADWCLTCQANKFFVLSAASVLYGLQEKDVVAMEADWTNHDPKITAYLKSFNQYGIPFYAVYGCKNPNGEFLGQILTPTKVIDALQMEKCSLAK